jgi:hypothetical protein
MSSRWPLFTSATSTCVRSPGATDGWLELAASSGGCTIALHKASVSQKSGAAMKIVFGVADVPSFKAMKEKKA